MADMADYIQEQPSVLRAIFDGRKENTALFVRQLSHVKPTHIYLIASGSSRNAASAAADFMAAVLKTDVTVAAPSYLPQIFSKSPYAVYISQGGSSTNTLCAMEKLAGIPHLALTGRKECRLNEVCENVMSIGCGEETAGPKTKGYTATVLTLSLMALEAAKALGSISEDAYRMYCNGFDNAISQLSTNLESVYAWFAQNKEAVMSISKCCIIGKNTASQAAFEGALKIDETMLIPAAAYEFEEFLHGPACTLDSEMAGIYFIPDESDCDYERMMKLAQFHKSLCKNAYTFGSTDECDCKITSCEWYAGVFAYILPCQIMAAACPADAGHKQFKYLQDALNTKYEGGI